MQNNHDYSLLLVLHVLFLSQIQEDGDTLLRIQHFIYV